MERVCVNRAGKEIIAKRVSTLISQGRGGCSYFLRLKPYPVLLPKLRGHLHRLQCLTWLVKSTKEQITEQCSQPSNTMQLQVKQSENGASARCRSTVNYRKEQYIHSEVWSRFIKFISLLIYIINQMVWCQLLVNVSHGRSTK